MFWKKCLCTVSLEYLKYEGYNYLLGRTELTETLWALGFSFFLMDVAGVRPFLRLHLAQHALSKQNNLRHHLPLWSLEGTDRSGFTALPFLLHFLQQFILEKQFHFLVVPLGLVLSVSASGFASRGGGGSFLLHLYSRENIEDLSLDFFSIGGLFGFIFIFLFLSLLQHATTRPLNRPQRAFPVWGTLGETGWISGDLWTVTKMKLFIKFRICLI